MVKRNKEKKKMVAAIRQIVEAAKELARIEEAEKPRKSRKPKRPTILAGDINA
jgi:hypothetical protein